MRSIQFMIRNCAVVISVFIFLIADGISTGLWAQAAQNDAASQSSNAAPAAAPVQLQPPVSAPSQPPGFDPVKRVPLYETIQEDWSSLAIGVSQLKPEPPLVAQIDEGNGFTRTLVQMKWRPGDPLDVYVVLPKGVKNPPAVLYLYGYKDDTDRFKDNRWCERVTKGGYAAVGFVSALSGSRFHDRPMRQWFVSELQESLGSTVHDVKFILDYLAQRGDIDMNRIGMFGQASGGAIAIMAAAADPRIKAVDVLDPWGDWPVWLEKSWVAQEDPDHARFTDAEFLKKVAPLDPVKWLPTLKTRRIRIQQVMENTATPDACKDAIKKAAPRRAEVVRFDHASQFADVASNGKLFDWVKLQLKTLPAVASPRRTAVAERVAPASSKIDSAATQR
ncbi:MAG: CocE/NonD family hydrolase [Candidatus Sulfotelmatobacter sp.]